MARWGRFSLVALRRRLSPGLPLSRFPRAEGKRSCHSTAVNDVRCCCGRASVHVPAIRAPPAFEYLILRRDLACAVTGLSTCLPNGRRREGKGAAGRCRGRCLYRWNGRDPGRDVNHAAPECTGILRSRPPGICVRHHTRARIFRKLSGDRALCGGVITAAPRLGTRTNRSCPGHSYATPRQCVQRSATRMDAPSYRVCSGCFEIDCCGS
jgi:hypothetical protein